jgi:DNA-binding transcriptional MocR family regulator
VIKKYDLMLIEDDCAGFMTYGYVADCGAPMHTLLPDNSVYICSMSKSFCSGIRIAFVAVPPAAYSSFERTIYNTNVKTSSLDAEIAAQGILDGTAELIADKRIGLAKERNALFDSILGDITGDIPGRHPYPFFRWLRLPDGADPQGTAARLLTQGVHVYSSERFCADPKAKEGFLRISLSAADSEEALKKGLEVIRDEIIKN